MEKKKFLVVADIHGKINSLNAAIEKFENEFFDYIVFLGDYVDSFDATDEEVVTCLIKVINLKLKYKERVICLIGNHDDSYIGYPNYPCSGFRSSYQKELTALFNENLALFKVAFQYKKHIFVHAGISKKWYTEYFNILEKDFKENVPLVKNSSIDISTILNYSFHTHHKAIISEVGYVRGGLPFNFGGPIWADRQELLQNIIRGYHQIVGHNKVPIIEKVTKFNGTHYNDTSITFCDVLDKKPFNFLKLEL